MSDFIENLINEAHINFLNNNYDGTVAQLKTIKLRINDTALLGRMQKKENDTDSEYHLRWTKLQAQDDIEYINKLMELKKWRAETYIVFYTRINSEIP